MTKIIAFLLYKCNFTFLELLISSLAEFEMNFNLFRNKELRELIDTCDFTNPEDNTLIARKYIPKGTIYCYANNRKCPFHAISKIAGFFYGEQMEGYCYYLKNGDFVFSRPTLLLWDMCKECGLNEE